MRKSVIFLALVFAAAVGRAQDNIVAVPYTMLNGHIFVTAVADGIEGRYLVDTGAPTLITHSRAMKNRGKEIAEAVLTDTYGNSTDGLSVVEMDSFELGELLLSGGGIQMIVLDEGNMIENLDIDGIVGSNFLANGVVRIDPRRNEILFAGSADMYGLDEADAIPMLLDEMGNVFIGIRFGQGIVETVQFDTGSGSLLEMQENLYAKLADKSVFEVIATGYGFDSAGAGGYEEPTESHRVKIAELGVGRGTLTNVAANTFTGHEWSLLGTSLLDYGSVTIDYPARRFYFEPFESGPADAYEADWDITIVIVGDHFEVGNVWSDADPQAEVGDIVVAIDGEAQEKTDLKTYLSYPKDDSSTTQELLLRKKEGTEYTITSRKR